MRRAILTLVAGIALESSAFAQEPPRIRAGGITGDLHVDGVLDEPMWASAQLVDELLASPAWVDKWTMYFGDQYQNTANKASTALLDTIRVEAYGICTPESASEPDPGRK